MTEQQIFDKWTQCATEQMVDALSKGNDYEPERDLILDRTWVHKLTDKWAEEIEPYLIDEDPEQVSYEMICILYEQWLEEWESQRIDVEINFHESKQEYDNANKYYGVPAR